tara:strand:- start:1685 stop:2953 length:1269 start_codon:yes stop_codon:yes gene_type:complete
MKTSLVKDYFKSDFNNVLNKFASAQVFSNFLRLISGFLVIKFIAPELYGQFIGVNIYVGYLVLLNLGTVNGLGREFPYEFGKNNLKFAKNLSNTVFSFCFVICIFIFLLFSILGLHNLINSDDLVTSLIFLSYSLIGPLTLTNKHFLPVLYKTNNDFDNLSNQNIKLGVINLFTVPLVYFYSIYGLILRACIISTLEFLLLYFNKPYKLKLKFNYSYFKKLIKTGLPIFTLGNINPLWENIVYNFILIVGGPLQYGLFALSSMIMSVFNVIPSSFSQVIYPKMSIMYGQKKKVKEIILFSIKPLFFLTLIIFALTLTLYYLLPVIIPILLPKYIDGISAAQWIIFIPLVLSFNPIHNIYNVIKKQKYMFISYILGAFVGTLFIYYHISIYDFNLIYFSQGLLLGFFFQQLLGFVLLKKIIND